MTGLYTDYDMIARLAKIELDINILRASFSALKKDALRIEEVAHAEIAQALHSSNSVAIELAGLLHRLDFLP